MNKVILVGRITRDPELRTIASGTGVVNFTVAVNRPMAQNNNNGDQNNDRNADFISCVVWNKQAENLAKYVKKGALIGVEGRLQTRQYDSNGTTRYVTEVLCDNVQFLESKNETNQQAQTSQPAKQEVVEDPFAGKINNASDEDLPF